METIQQILTKHWGYSRFRPLQEDIINAILRGHDTLALLPTGGGKSICFQVPALSREGLCIVISPLIALMKDQVENLKKKNIPAIAIVSGMSRNEVDIALDNCIYGKIKFLYLSPERLGSELVRERIRKMKVSLLAVDEAHCISQWGYDFRPPYLAIAEVRELLPGVPVLALTATATPEVRKDIQEKLLFRNQEVFTGGFERKNLSYVVLYEEDKQRKMTDILNKVPGSSIVYVRNRKKTKEIAEWLTKKKITADYYHGGLDALSRNMKQDSWKKGNCRVMVATNAFGMGIDKPDVRTVIHMGLPDSIEAYYQEAGRAGRDEKRSYAVILYNESDIAELRERAEKEYPAAEDIRRVYQALANAFQVAAGSGEGSSHDFDLTLFCNTFRLGRSLVIRSLSILEREGLLAASEPMGRPSRIHVLMSHKDLYHFEVTHPAFDRIMKTLLRSYEGMFQEYAAINEKEIASRCGMKEEEVAGQLRQLKTLKIIDYIPRNRMPVITFTTPRIDAKQLRISPENLALRKKVFVSKINAVIGYAEKNSKCRSQYLLSYLGEEIPQRCGNCDVCLGRNKLELSDLEFSSIKDEIKNLLSKRAMTMEETVSLIQSGNEIKRLKVLQWLMDNGKITHGKNNRLEYNI